MTKTLTLTLEMSSTLHGRLTEAHALANKRVCDEGRPLDQTTFAQFIMQVLEDTVDERWLETERERIW